MVDLLLQSIALDLTCQTLVALQDHVSFVYLYSVELVAAGQVAAVAVKVAGFAAAAYLFVMQNLVEVGNLGFAKLVMGAYGLGEMVQKRMVKVTWYPCCSC